jgi:hypothetical protein
MMNDDIYRTPRLLIPENSPLSLLSMAGREALDYLFAPGVEVWITDMVEIEATRDPDPGDDQRTEQRRAIAEWFGDNSHIISVMETAVGREYSKTMTNWRIGGNHPDLKPDWADRGDYSLFDILKAAETFVEDSARQLSSWSTIDALERLSDRTKILIRTFFQQELSSQCWNMNSAPRMRPTSGRWWLLHNSANALFRAGCPSSYCLLSARYPRAAARAEISSSSRLHAGRPHHPH